MATISRTNARLDELGLTLPAPFPTYGTYVMASRAGHTLYSTGHVPIDGERPVTGKLGRELGVAEGYRAARLAALSLLATLQAELGDLDRIDHLVYLYGTVNAVPEFTEHTAVINGASDLLVEVLGEAGRHARLAVGVASLPANVAVEIQVVAELRADAG
jgi:enamine deaminase RidA (YjgF/YER057c/UK114 family)